MLHLHRIGVGVKHGMKRGGTLGGVGEVATIHVGKRIGQRPQVTPRKLVMLWAVPLVHNVSHLRLGASTSTEATNDKVVSGAVVKLGRLVRVDTFLGAIPRFAKLANRTGKEARQVTEDVSRVSASKHDFIIEDHVGANERCITCTNHRTAGFVVRVAKPKDCANFIAMLARDALDLEQAKVTLTIAVQRVMLLHDFERVVVVDSGTEVLNQAVVCDRLPVVLSFWSLDSLHIRKVGGFASTYMKIEELRICDIYHNDF